MADRLFVLGGRRSGKSRYAFERARAAAGDNVTFVATARAGDPELDARIAAHRAHRPPAWRTTEVESDLAAAIRGTPAGQLLLIDSLTLWASTVIEREGTLRSRWSETEAAFAESHRLVVLVSEEAGMGLVPMDELARRFLDELGRLNQAAAAWCDEVRLMVAGIPVRVKGGS